MTDKRYEISQRLSYTRMVKICESRYPGMHPANVVTYLRVGERMTQEQAANHLGVSISCIRRWQKPEASVHNITPLEMLTKRNNANRLNERIRKGEIKSGKRWRSQFANGWVKNESR
jgi:DNA-binding transcriptional regulator YiaG